MATPEPGVDGLRLPPIGAPRIRQAPRTLADVLLLSPGPDQQPSRAAAISPGPLRGGATYSTGSRPGTVEGASVRLGGPRAGVSALTAAHNARTLDPLKIVLDGDKKPRHRQAESRGGTTYLTQHDEGGGEDGSSPVVSLLAGPGDDDVLRTPGAGGPLSRARQVPRPGAFKSTRPRKPIDAPTGGRPSGSMTVSTRRRAAGAAVKAVAEDADPEQVGKLNDFLARPAQHGERGNEGYIARRLRRLHAEPAMLDSFQRIVGGAIDEAAKLRREARGENDIIRRNAREAGRASPAHKRDHLASVSVQRDQRVAQAQQRHQTLVDHFVETAALDGERRKEARHAKLQLAWLPVMAFAARSSFLAAAVVDRRERKRAAVRNAAAQVIQRRVRVFLSGRPPVTPLRAFLIRARFLRRVLTRVRVRLREGQAERVRGFLRVVATENALLPLYFAMRRYAHSIVRVQRRVRARAALRRAQFSLLVRQWERCKQDVVDDFRLVAKRGALEGASPAMQQDGARAGRELAVLTALTDERRDGILNNYAVSYRAKHLVAMAKYIAAATKYCVDAGIKASRIQSNGMLAPPRDGAPTVGRRWRGGAEDQLPATIDGVERPVFHLLIPRTTLAMMVRAAARNDAPA